MRPPRRPRSVRSPAGPAAAVLLAVTALAAVTATSGQASSPPAVPGRIGPSLATTGNGRTLHPIGTLTTLGVFPTAAALTPDGRFAWVADSGHGRNDVQVLDVASGRIVQSLPLPGAYGGVAFTPDGTRAYVSGSPVSPDKPSGPTKGDQGDVLHVFAVDAATGHGTERDPITLPPASGGSGQTQSLPPVKKLYPAGLAVSPDGRTVAVALQQADRAVLVDVASGATRSVRVGRYPAATAFDRDGRAYVSNAYDGTVSVIDVTRGKVLRTLAVGGLNSQPEGMVADPRSGRLYVAVTQADRVAVIDTDAGRVVRQISVGRGEALGTQPTALAVDPDGATLYVANSGEDTLAAIALTDRPANGRDPRGHRVYRVPPVTALRTDDQAVRAEARRLAREQRAARTPAARRTAQQAHARRQARLRRTLARTAPVRGCAGPTQRQAAAYRRAVLAALHGPAGRRAAALRRAQRALPPIRPCPGDGAIPGLKAYSVIGRLPVAAYPTAVLVTPDASRLIWIAGKGLGSGPNPDFVFAGDKRAFGKVQTPYGSYVLDKLLGRAGRLALPTDRQLQAMTRAAEAQAVPANQVAAPAGTVLRPGGPIKHVFYVVRENRTYDQVLGSDPRGDGDPKLELFDDNGVAAPVGGVTPNAHALARRFPLLDHVYADSEVSVDGHLITAGSIANDYVQKSTAQNYSRPGKSFDFGLFPITFGPNGFVFDQAVRQGVSFRNYGEGGAGTLPFSAGRPTYLQVQAATDLVYPNNLQIGCLVPAGPIGDLATCAQDSGPLGHGGSLSAIPSRLSLFTAQFTAQVATGTVPAFNYLILPNDHTNGTVPNAYSPQALIADNDLGLGQLVDLISHSSIWASSAIFVLEDDSQDGADHVDAHRMPAFVISPWARRGAVVSTRYDQYSMLRSAELLAGLAPLSINDALAVPMYDAFDTTADVAGTRYTAIRPQQSLTEVNAKSAPMAALSRALPFGALDLVPQAVLDRILWASVHGARSTAPSPGPNASDEEHARGIGVLRSIARTGDGRAWLRLRADPRDAPPAAGAATVRQAPGPPESPLPTAVRALAAAEARRALRELGR